MYLADSTYCSEGVADLYPMKQSYMLTFDVGHEQEEKHPWFRDGDMIGVGEGPSWREHALNTQHIFKTSWQIPF